MIHGCRQLTIVRENFLPPTEPGLNCVSFDELQRMMLGHAVTGIFIDVALLALPLWLLYSNMIWSKKTLQVMMVFALGVFAVVTGIIRFSLMVKANIIIDP